MEAHEVVNAGLVADGTVKDVRFFKTVMMKDCSLRVKDPIWLAHCTEQDRRLVRAVGHNFDARCGGTGAG